MNCEKEIKSLKKIITDLTKRIEDLENKNNTNSNNSSNNSYKKPYDNKVYLESKKDKLVIRGNSYSIKDFIKANKGMWNNSEKLWEISNGLTLVDDIIACLKENEIEYQNNVKLVKKKSKTTSKSKTNSSSKTSSSSKSGDSNICLLDSDDD